VQDQKNLGACSSFALDGGIESADHGTGKPFTVNSHLQMYYNARTRTEKAIDSGATLRDALKALSVSGAAPETLWPYDITKFAISPPAPAIKAGFRHTAVKYARVGVSPLAVVQALQAGYPVIAGIVVYESFEAAQVARDGFVPVPHTDTEKLYGGHAVLIVGYVLTPYGWRFKVRNSWGEGWGDKGYFYLPLEYINSTLCWDFLTLTALSGSPKAKLMVDDLVGQYGMSEDVVFEYLPALYELLKGFLTGEGRIHAELRLPVQQKLAQFLESVGV